MANQSNSLQQVLFYVLLLLEIQTSKECGLSNNLLPLLFLLCRCIDYETKVLAPNRIDWAKTTKITQTPARDQNLVSNYNKTKQKNTRRGAVAVYVRKRKRKRKAFQVGPFQTTNGYIFVFPCPEVVAK